MKTDDKLCRAVFSSILIFGIFCWQNISHAGAMHSDSNNILQNPGESFSDNELDVRLDAEFSRRQESVTQIEATTGIENRNSADYISTNVRDTNSDHRKNQETDQTIPQDSARNQNYYLKDPGLTNTSNRNIRAGNTLSYVTKRLVNKISRANFTHGIENNEPVDAIVSISQSYGKMYFFTELLDLKGQVIKHQWEHKGQVKAEVVFDVASPRWRVYSSKNIVPDSLGTWTVTVTNAKGRTLAKTSIIVVK